ncbi:uncharacterized protein A4U43_C07F26960 [Asparagus officinalis]|uniref:Uncharacterized protein n=1 Tax=Asparagus officinalis TaxID=4686 RepID=A0A5P1EIT2_ASPOF|nr:uncharacterized protein A4U43_C07F26960 [Asparagus officinalis]
MGREKRIRGFIIHTYPFSTLWNAKGQDDKVDVSAVSVLRNKSLEWYGEGIIVVANEGSFRSNVSLPWMIMKAFNNVVTLDEKFFANLVADYEVRDLVDCLEFCGFTRMGTIGY